MWRRACPLLTVAFAAGLVTTRRRLSEAQAELANLRGVARSPAAGAAAEALATKPETTGNGAVATGPDHATEVATGASDLSAEWEQAGPPMDS